ncbi:hypothetical protein [Sorangium atrum]|uniref:Beta-lactamase n=1 Tax=Sorangium atrum TaxID=2995308 RepID=A0ABT5BX51_9BACT|nr:hypothetical protein [Sorangium aterium]MDC0678703.1 hypothetical protein [Sorangium aterium]
MTHVKMRLAAILLPSCAAVSLLACGPSAPPADAPPAQAPPGASRAAPAPVVSPAPAEPASSAATAAPAPAKTCSDAQDIDTCETECAAGKAAACETLGDLHAKAEGKESPGFSLGSALRAFGEACKLGAKSACDKREAHLKELRAACQKSAKSCFALGDALSGQDGHDKEVDESFDRACNAGDVAACEERGELHMDLEPAKIHAAIAEKALDRACASGSAHACCSLVKVYTDTDREKKADAARARVEAANDRSQQGRIACDVFRMGGKPKVRVIAKANAESAKALSKQEIALLEEVLSRRVPYCYAEPPKGPAELDIELVPDGAAKLAGYTGVDSERCVSRIVERIHLAGAASRRARFGLGFEAAK